jgi:hypothetical protein
MAALNWAMTGLGDNPEVFKVKKRNKLLEFFESSSTSETKRLGRPSRPFSDRVERASFAVVAGSGSVLKRDAACGRRLDKTGSRDSRHGLA